MTRLPAQGTSPDELWALMDQARADDVDWREITRPKIVLPFSGHPAFDKATHYFGLETIRTPLRDDCRVDLDAYRAAVTDDTILEFRSIRS